MDFTFGKRLTLLAGTVFLFCTTANGSITSLSQEECNNMQVKGVISHANPVTCDRLQRVNFRHIDFDSMIRDGNLVVLDIVADHVEAIFSELFIQRFPLQQAVVMENYQGDDDAAMADNNTSAFNGRPMTGGTSWSRHAWGVAIDINPLQNPYIAFPEDGTARISPAASSRSFINRSELRPDKKRRQGMAEEVVDVFARHGFIIWGGDWDSPIDFQHFEIGSRTFLEQLISQPFASAHKKFNQYIDEFNLCLASHAKPDVASKRSFCIQQVRQ